MLTSINDTGPWGTIHADSITIDAAGRTTAENEITPVQPLTVPAAFSATYDVDNRIATVNGIGLHSTPVSGLTLLSDIPNIAYGQLLNYGTVRDGLPTSPPDITNPH